MPARPYQWWESANYSVPDTNATERPSMRELPIFMTRSVLDISETNRAELGCHIPRAPTR